MTTVRGEELGLNVFCRKYVNFYPYALYKDRGSLSQYILVSVLVYMGWSIEGDAQESLHPRAQESAVLKMLAFSVIAKWMKEII